MMSLPSCLLTGFDSSDGRLFTVIPPFLTNSRAGINNFYHISHIQAALDRGSVQQ